jgi:Lectin C-type domain
MKVTSILGWPAAAFHLLFVVRLADATRPERDGGHGPDHAAFSEPVRALKGMKGCNPGGMGMKAMKCPVPRRPPPPPPPPPPTRRLTAAPSAVPSSSPSAAPSTSPSVGPSSSPSESPSAPPSEDACLTYATNPSGPRNHLYGVMDAGDPGIYWTDAQAAVAQMKPCCGGVRPHMVSISSKAENDFVLSLFTGNLTGSGRSKTTFIGLTNRNQPSRTTFAWDGTSEPFVYENWCKASGGCAGNQQPNGPPNSCVEMALVGFATTVTPGVWYDVDCAFSISAFFVIEYDCP